MAMLGVGVSLNHLSSFLGPAQSCSCGEPRNRTIMHVEAPCNLPYGLAVRLAAENLFDLMRRQIRLASHLHPTGNGAGAAERVNDFDTPGSRI